MDSKENQISSLGRVQTMTYISDVGLEYFHAFGIIARQELRPICVVEIYKVGARGYGIAREGLYNYLR